MSDEYKDPSGDTQAFRAFVNQPQPEPQRSSRTPLIIGGAVLAAVVVILFVVLIVA